jgi:hypothetical protein
MLRNALGAAALICVAAGSLWAETTDATGKVATAGQLQKMQSELDSLRSQLSDVRASQSETWLSERRAQEVKSLVRDVLADADMRASMAEGGTTAGHNGENFFLSNDDGSFLLNVSGQIQARYIANFRDDSGADDNEAGFTIARTKVQFAGHVADPRITYAVQLAVNRDTNAVTADKIVLGYGLTDNLSIWAGEDKAPFLREEITSSAHQLAVERSAVNELFTLDKVQGIGATWTLSDNTTVQVMWSDGARSGVTAKDFEHDSSDFALTTRVDIRLMGDSAQASDYSSAPGEGAGLFVGGAFHWEAGESGTTAVGDDDDFYSWTIDASYENQGLSLSGAVVGLHSELDDDSIAGGAADTDTHGYVAQIAYNMDSGNGRSTEPFFRYEHIDLDAAGDATLLTGGVNWYLSGHSAKFTADIVYALDPVVQDTGLGLLADAATEDGQVALRAQFQLLF